MSPLFSLSLSLLAFCAQFVKPTGRTTSRSFVLRLGLVFELPLLLVGAAPATESDTMLAFLGFVPGRLSVSLSDGSSVEVLLRRLARGTLRAVRVVARVDIDDVVLAEATETDDDRPDRFFFFLVVVRDVRPGADADPVPVV